MNKKAIINTITLLRQGHPRLKFDLGFYCGLEPPNHNLFVNSKNNALWDKSLTITNAGGYALMFEQGYISTLSDIFKNSVKELLEITDTEYDYLITGRGQPLTWNGSRKITATEAAFVLENFRDHEGKIDWMILNRKPV